MSTTTGFVKPPDPTTLLIVDKRHLFPETTNPLHLHVHPGIGDLAWLYAKFSSLDRPLHLTVAEDKTGRSMPFLDLLPNVIMADYGTQQLDYEYLNLCWNTTYERLLEEEEKGSKLYLSCNNWLDNGNRLEEWIPDLPTDFHFDIPIPQESLSNSLYALPPGGCYIGIHTASIGAADAWNAWGVGEWLGFIQRIHRDFANPVFVLMGAKWDTPMVRQLEMALKPFKQIRYVNLSGRTVLSDAIAIIRRCRYFVGFASGMAILSTILGIPTLMLYPGHLDKLMYSWPPTHSIGMGSYIGLPWGRIADVYQRCFLPLYQALM